MRQPRMLLPKSDNGPAKIKDPGVIEFVKAGCAAYNAKTQELLLLPRGEEMRRELAANVRAALFRESGIQQVDCGGDAALYSLADRFVREWDADARFYAEERGRNIRVLAWCRDDEEAAALSGTVRGALLSSADAERYALRFVEAVPDAADETAVFHLLSPSEPGALATMPGFRCPGCSALFLPDSPAGYVPRQPGANEAEEPLADIETPGANTIAELCKQLGIEIARTLKAMLYIAVDAEGARHPVAAFVRGDFNMSMAKLSRRLREASGLTGLRSADKAELQAMVGEVAGYCGPVGLPDNVVVICDESVRGGKNTVAGANRAGYHKKGCCHPRDFDPPFADIAQYAQGSPCPHCETPIESAALRASATISYGPHRATEELPKTLSYRDREGEHAFPVVLRGDISLESILLATHSDR